jgi:hypothetical protein
MKLFLLQKVKQYTTSDIMNDPTDVTLAYIQRGSLPRDPINRATGKPNYALADLVLGTDMKNTLAGIRVSAEEYRSIAMRLAERIKDIKRYYETHLLPNMLLSFSIPELTLCIHLYEEVLTLFLLMHHHSYANRNKYRPTMMRAAHCVCYFRSTIMNYFFDLFQTDPYQV